MFATASLELVLTARWVWQADEAVDVVTQFRFELDDKGVESLECQRCFGWFAPSEEGLQLNMRHLVGGEMIECDFLCPLC